jgi:hypothetical protein
MATYLIIWALILIIGILLCVVGDSHAGELIMLGAFLLVGCFIYAVLAVYHFDPAVMNDKSNNKQNISLVETNK